MTDTPDETGASPAAPPTLEKAMDIHRPKAMHNLRELAKEIAIITIGVVIALIGELAVSTLHWRAQMAEGREALIKDYVDILSYAREREAESPCLGQRLAALSAIVDDAGNTGRLPPLGKFGNPHSREWGSGGWRSLVASGVAVHYDPDEARRYSAIADYAEWTVRMNDAELETWAQLYTMAGPGRRIDAAGQDRLRAALSRAHYQAKMMRVASKQITDDIAETSLGAEAKRRMPSPKRAQQLSLCQPVAAVPAHYGEAPMNFELQGPIE